MRDYGIVSPQFWIGESGRAMRGNLAQQVTALYLMTSPHANMIGVYYCPLDYIGKETGMGLEGASKALFELQEGGFCSFDKQSEEVFVHRMAAFQIGERLDPKDNRCKGIARELEKVASAQLQHAFLAMYSGAFNLKHEAPKTTKTKPPTSPSKAPPKPEAGSEAGSEEGSAAAVATAPATGFAIPLVDGTEWPVPVDLLGEWQKAFPAADVEQELREMRVWSVANPSNRKTARGVASFAVRWLQKAQDTPGRSASRRQQGGDDWTRSAA